jgi:dTDP-glucose 4,6-dehydratase
MKCSANSLKGENITVYGTGTQTRSFCYVDDLIEGINKLLYSKETEPVNLGNPEEITI